MFAPYAVRKRASRRSNHAPERRARASRVGWNCLLAPRSRRCSANWSTRARRMVMAATRPSWFVLWRSCRRALRP